MRGRWRGLATLLAALVVVGGAWAAPIPVEAQDACREATEPDDTPEAAPQSSGPFCVAGELTSGDQDLVLWDVPAASASSSWQFGLTGVGGTLTSLRLLPVTSEPGVTPLTVGSQLAQLDSPPEATAPVTVRDLLLRPGRYLLGISRTDRPEGGSPATETYSFDVTAAGPPDEASAVEGAFAIAGATTIGEPALIEWTVPDGTTDEAWSIEARGVLGVTLTLSLEAADGTELANRYSDALGGVMFPDLALEPGTYRIVASASSDTPAPFRLSATSGPRELDPEPNDLPGAAVPLDPARPVARGRIWPASDRDHFRLEIPADAPMTLLDIRVVSAEGRRRSICLYQDAISLQCRDGATSVTLANLLLAPGSYIVAVGGDADVPPDAPAGGAPDGGIGGYLLRVDTTAAPAADFEIEPNDDPARASPLDPALVMRGRGASGDSDVFRFTVAGEPQLWEAEARGPGIDRLAWVRGDGTTLTEARPDATGEPARVSDLYLVPGEHLLRVGAVGDYELGLTPLGPPDPDAEREPNDDAAFAEPLRLSRTRIVGRLPRPSDRDVFRFSLGGTERIVITVTPPADTAMDIAVETNRTQVARARAPEVGAPSTLDLSLEPGDYEIVVTTAAGSSGSQGRYQLNLERGDPLALRDDAEPNDIAEWASALPADGTIRGSGAGVSEFDWYQLPVVDATTAVRVTVAGDVGDAWLSDGVSDLPVDLDLATGVLASDGTLGLVPRFLRVFAHGAYDVVVEIDGRKNPPEPAPLPLSMSVTPSVDVVAAYWPSGQRLTAEVALTNAGWRPVDLELDAATSHHAWIASIDEPRVRLEPGGSASVPIAIEAQPDAWADDPVLIHVRARDEAGAQATASTAVTPRRDAEPVEPALVWPLPDALLGGLDVASLALGATPLPAFDPAGEADLHDGVTVAARGFLTPAASLPVTLTVDLAGDAPIPIAGTILDPIAAQGVPGDVPAGFELLLSSDGATYTPVLAGRLSTLMAEQPFVLDEPIEATHAQLRILGNHGGAYAQAALGEWKVVAVPGSVPTAASGPAALATTGLDLGRQAAGGHVSWFDPQVDHGVAHVAMVDDDPAAQTVWVEPGDALSWAMGFRSGRAAQVDHLEWVDPAGSNPEQRFDQVEVAVSLDGSAGPWREAGSWTLERAADGSVAPFTFPDGTWARAVRISTPAIRRQQVAVQRELPGLLRVIERATDDEYRSILGEWGATSPAGPYERLVPPVVEPPPDGLDDDDTPETATLLPPGQRASGRVSAEADVDWYAIRVPEGDNSLRVQVDGRPIVGVALTLVDAEGLRVPMLFGPGSRPGSVEYRAEVTPGAEYRLEVRQPPSSIVFAYDTSASVGPYLEEVYHGLRAFSADVTPGRESVLVLPFEEDPLIETWSDDRFELQNAIDRRPPAGGSSAAETTLIEATTELSAREGARAILLVTDAETGSYERNAEMWRAFAAVRPLVFAIHIGGASDPLVFTAFMQDWALAGGGVYRYAGTHGELDRAFDRLATWLRRPAGYQLVAETAFFEEPPPSREPGTIAIRSAANGSTAAIAPDVGVEIVLDTSGSMLERIGRRRRIEVAREALRDLVTERLPAGTPVALRIFGDGEDACGSRLAVPLGPLDPASMAAFVDALEVDRETSTPIAAALARVPDDLAGTSGTRVVLLITDGEETCDGDVEAAIRDLERRGIDARVNIVGFTVRERRIRRDMQAWARLGGGSYFDARGAEDLGRAMAQAVRAPFRVLDESGNEVAAGTLDGEPVEVDPGTYSILVLADPVVRFDAITVGPGESVSRELPPPAPDDPEREPEPAP